MPMTILDRLAKRLMKEPMLPVERAEEIMQAHLASARRKTVRSVC